ncbi:hypothetical protein Ait01nite_032550 [Actinoplanes italicus]|nr:hypothetical protein Ait01nite_032550 [Actinoplanes italicus]
MPNSPPFEASPETGATEACPDTDPAAAGNPARGPVAAGPETGAAPDPACRSDPAALAGA